MRNHRQRARARETSGLNNERKPAAPFSSLTVVLFDIDGTLILTGGAGNRAMSRAFHDQFGVAGAFDGIPMAGRTDRAILRDAVARARLDLDDATLREFGDRYIARLNEALNESGSPGRVLPGVVALLESLTSRADVFLALLTGNSEAGARLKLQHFGLWRFFRCGAFGGETHERNDLFGVAMARTRECGIPEVPADQVIVVGDTEMDIAVAVAAGARSVGVATGTSSLATLQAAGADHVFEDLADVGAFLRLL